MSLHADLIDQARHLARREKTRPKQASLRRSVSSAYYGLFHFLADRATRQMMGTDPARRHFRFAVVRGFNHGTMKSASEHFSKGRLPQQIQSSFPQFTVSADLRSIASSFVKLQQERHRADYDLAKDFSRGEVLTLIDQAETAIGLWKTVQNDDAAKLYRATLPIWDRMSR